MSRGFISLPVIQAVAVGAVVLAVGGYIWHCEKTKRDHAAFVRETALLGAQAQQEAYRKERFYQKQKEKFDADTKSLRAANRNLSHQLFHARSSQGYLPPAPPAASRPERIAFDRTELERTIRRLDERVSDLIREGDEARIGLDVAKGWIRSLESD